MPSSLNVSGSCALEEMLEHRDVLALLALLNLRDRGWRRERAINNLNSAPCQENLTPATADTRLKGHGVTWQ